MTPLELTINGRAVSANIPPRVHLADFLREHEGLTGTHLGCEHGVCGACTILIDGAPARSCIAFAVDCAGRSVLTIEGLEADPVMTRLRAAFTTAHALQCGYCTPGMLVTARDIVIRLPEADDERIRLELAGNLCRCTGYLGIVRAIRMVLNERLEIARPERTPLATLAIGGAQKTEARERVPTNRVVAHIGGDGGSSLTLRLPIAAPRDVVWRALRNTALIASCLPGARLTGGEGGRIEGEMVAALGPIRARFAGHATLAYDDATLTGTADGAGRDPASGSSLTAGARFRVIADESRSVVELEMDYALRGALAQFGRGPVVRVFAAEIAALMGGNLEAALNGTAPPPRAGPLPGLALVVRMVWRWLGLLAPRRR